MLYSPEPDEPTQPESRRAQTGLVATSHQGRQVFRALTIPTNRRTPPQTASRARHMSITAAQALQPDDVIAAWAMAAAQFPGHDLIPADITNNVAAMTTYLPMTPAQFQYMCQSTQMAFGNTPTTMPAWLTNGTLLNSYSQTPWFSQGKNMYTGSVYDHNYNCIGFTLSYTYLPYGDNFGGYLGNQTSGYYLGSPPTWQELGWIISATSVGASSVSAKSGSGFTVLGYYIGWPTPAQLLADWIAVYGDLPDKGTIYFSVRPADPVNGVTGMEMTERVSFENGTLEGAIIPPAGATYFSGSPYWFGPFLSKALTYTGIVANMGDGGEIMIEYQGNPAPGGGGWTSGDPYSGTLSFVAKIASESAFTKELLGYYALMPSPPITFTFSPTQLVIPSGSTTPVSVVATCHIPADTVAGVWLFRLEATDGKQVVSILVEVTNL